MAKKPWHKATGALVDEKVVSFSVDSGRSGNPGELLHQTRFFSARWYYTEDVLKPKWAGSGHRGVYGLVRLVPEPARFTLIMSV